VILNNQILPLSKIESTITIQQDLLTSNLLNLLLHSWLRRSEFTCHFSICNNSNNNKKMLGETNNNNSLSLRICSRLEELNSSSLEHLINSNKFFHNSSKWLTKAELNNNHTLINLKMFIINRLNHTKLQSFLLVNRLNKLDRNYHLKSQIQL
jgi:hypothetical protein